MIAMIASSLAVYLLAFILRRILLLAGKTNLSVPLSVLIAFVVEVVMLWAFDSDAMFFWLAVVWIGLLTLAFGVIWIVFKSLLMERASPNG